MITAVAVVPTTPLALPGVPGQTHPGVAGVGAAAGRVTRGLVDVELVVVVAGGSRPAALSPPPTDLGGYGLQLAAHDLIGAAPAVVEALRAALDDGVPGFSATPSPVTRAPEVVEPDLAVLARWAPLDIPCVGLVVPSDAPPQLCEDVAAALTGLAGDRRVGLLVAGDLGAGHGPKPPRPAAATASAILQDLVVAALDNGRPADLVRIDPALAADSASRAVGALRVLGAVLQTARLGTVVRAADAPLGVGYVVAQGG